MKKLLLTSILTVFSVVLVINIVYSLKMDKSSDIAFAKIVRIANADSETGEPVTCYSTIENGDKYNIWRCGSCVEQDCDNYFDEGTCTP